MVSTHTNKKGVRYCYYVSQAALRKPCAVPTAGSEQSIRLHSHYRLGIVGGIRCHLYRAGGRLVPYLHGYHLLRHPRPLLAQRDTLAGAWPWIASAARSLMPRFVRPSCAALAAQLLLGGGLQPKLPVKQGGTRGRR
jgi:hypothetical protein